MFVRKRINWQLLGVAIIAMMIISPAGAKVVDAAPGGFTVQHSVDVTASPTIIYEAMINHVGHWWSSDHTYSGDADNLTIDARPLGCFCERLPFGPHSGVAHMMVTFVKPGETLRLTGGLGPLGLMGVAGNMTWEFRDGDKKGKSTVILTYAVGGYSVDGLDAIASGVNGMLGEQLARLKHWVETGQAE